MARHNYDFSTTDRYKTGRNYILDHIPSGPDDSPLPRRRNQPDGYATYRRKRKLYSDSTFYDHPYFKYPTIEEQRNLAKVIAESLENAECDQASLGHLLFLERRKKAEFWTFDEKRTERDWLMGNKEGRASEEEDIRLIKKTSAPQTLRIPEQAASYDVYGYSSDDGYGNYGRYDPFQLPSHNYVPPSPPVTSEKVQERFKRYDRRSQMSQSSYEPHHCEEDDVSPRFESPRYNADYSSPYANYKRYDDTTYYEAPRPDSSLLARAPRSRQTKAILTLGRAEPPPPPRPLRSSSAMASSRAYPVMAPVPSVNPDVSDKFVAPEPRRPWSKPLTLTAYEDLRLSSDKCKHNNLSPEACFSLTAEMKSLSGRGAEMFAQRAKRMNKFTLTSEDDESLGGRNEYNWLNTSYRQSPIPSNCDYEYEDGFYYSGRPDSNMASQGRKLNVLHRNDYNPTDFAGYQQPEPYYDYDGANYNQDPYQQQQYYSQPQQPQQSYHQQHLQAPQNPYYAQPNYGAHGHAHSYTASTASLHSSRDHSRGSTPKPAWQQSGKSVDPDFFAHLSQSVPKSPSYVSPALQEQLHPYTPEK